MLSHDLIPLICTKAVTESDSQRARKRGVRALAQASFYRYFLLPVTCRHGSIAAVYGRSKYGADRGDNRRGKIDV